MHPFPRARTLAIALPCALALGGVSGTAAGAAFALKEQSATALGNAFAGATAGAEDITYSFFNPAALAWGSGTEIALVGSYILPEFEYESDDPTAGNPYPGDHSSRSREAAFVPVGYAAWELRDDIRMGVGVTVPYGLETDYDRDWIGRYDAINTELLTIDINPTIAWRVNEQLALAAGLSAQYADASLSSAVPGQGMDPATDGKLDVEGDNWGYGFNLGALFEPVEGTRLGIAYRSRITHDLSGDAEYDPADFGPGTAEPQDVGGSAKLRLPETLSLGVHQEINDRWAVMADATWTRWSRFDELGVFFDEDITIGTTMMGPITSSGNVDEYSWNDTWFVALGTTYRPNEQWALRVGVAHDESPVDTCCRTPRIPDEDRTWLAFGATYAPNDNVKLDFGYTHIWLDDADIVLNDENPNVPDVEGEYDSSVQILTASFNYRF